MNSPTTTPHPRWQAFRAKHALVVGLTGRTGRSAVELFSNHGLKVSVSDTKTEAQLHSVLEGLPAETLASLTIFAGAQTAAQLNGVDFILLSPGVPRSIPLIRAAVERGIPIYNDVDFIFPFLPDSTKVAAITGTDGKSTVTELIHYVCEGAGKSVACGNNGVPVFEVFDALMQADFVVMEVSSYMLEDPHFLKPDAAIITNIAADHLDRYDSMEDYAAAKFNLARFMSAGDLWVKNLDNAWTAKFRPAGPSVTTVSAKERGDFYFDGGSFHFPNGFHFPYSACRLKGVHHIENILVSLPVLKRFGLSDELIAARVQAFPGLPHRLQFVPTKKKIGAYDDSKATTIQSVQRALDSFERGVILILGGRDKGLDFTELKPNLGCVKLVVAYGEAREKIAGSLSGATLHSVFAFDEAVRQAWGAAVEGDAIVLSPACTSWDQHKDYAERGQRFQTLIRELDSQS